MSPGAVYEDEQPTDSAAPATGERMSSWSSSHAKSSVRASHGAVVGNATVQVEIHANHNIAFPQAP